MLPRFSMAGRCLTITLFLAIRTAALPSVTVVIIGKNSGVRPTASATAKRSDSSAPVERDARGDDEKDQEEDGAHDEQAELPHPALELGLGGPRSEARGDVAEHGLATGRDHDRRRRAAHHRRSEEHHVAALVERYRLGVRSRVLLGGHGLSRERSLVHVEVARLEKLRVGRHEVTRREPHDVSGHDFGSPDLAPLAVAEDRRRRCHSLAQPRRGTLRAVRLHEVEQRAQDDHRDDDERVGELDRGTRR